VQEEQAAGGGDLQAERSTVAPFQINAASTTTTAEFSSAIDRMRQRIGTARNIWTM
jgi:hypothetical protein